jgi:N-acyl-D-aspartate/D-glutamate deacylase
MSELRRLRIRGATIVDGTGAPGRTGGLLIENGRFAVDDGRPVDESIEADGLVAAPGFVDIHTHYDAQVFWDPMLSPSPHHGVTTVVSGNCGFSLAPMASEHEEYIARMLARVEGMPYEAIAESVPWGWSSYAELLAQLDKRGTGLNIGVMAGHSTIRRFVMGERAVGNEATTGEIEQMARMLDAALTDGALGFSTSQASTQPDANGDPVPSRWATTRELERLAAQVRGHDGTMLQYSPPGDRLDDATVDLMIKLSLAGDRPINWNLLIVGRYDEDYCDHQLSASDRAAAAGAVIRGLMRPDPTIFRVSFANCRTMTAFKNWTELDLPIDELRRRLEDPVARRSLRDRAETSTRGRVSSELYVRWADYIVGETVTPSQAALRGRTVGAIAAERGADPFDTLLDIALTDSLQAGFYPQADDGGPIGWAARARLCSDPRLIVGGSDAGGHLDMMCGPIYSTALLGEYPKRGLLSVEECVRLLTDVPARYIGLRDRGRIHPGFHADLVLFDPERVGVGDFDFRYDLPAGGARVWAGGTGIERVLVNGVSAMVAGEKTGELGGYVLHSGRDTRTVTNLGIPAES